MTAIPIRHPLLTHAWAIITSLARSATARYRSATALQSDCCCGGSGGNVTRTIECEFGIDTGFDLSASLFDDHAGEVRRCRKFPDPGPPDPLPPPDVRCFKITGPKFNGILAPCHMRRDDTLANSLFPTCTACGSPEPSEGSPCSVCTTDSQATRDKVQVVTSGVDLCSCDPAFGGVNSFTYNGSINGAFVLQQSAGDACAWELDLDFGVSGVSYDVFDGASCTPPALATNQQIRIEFRLAAKVGAKMDLTITALNPVFVTTVFETDVPATTLVCDAGSSTTIFNNKANQCSDNSVWAVGTGGGTAVIQPV